MIGVYYPRGAETGGPEALHQLVDALRKQGICARLIPMPGTEFNTRVAEYKKYDAPEVSRRTKIDAVVAPEIALDLLDKFGDNVDKYAWWLAAGYSPSTSKYNNLVQSSFAKGVLWDELVESKMLSDYTGEHEVPEKVNDNGIVAYNGNKGAAECMTVASLMPHVKFVAIQNMTREQVSETLANATVYLDLGHHPGKDRMPREAALRGAVVVVGRNGSARLSDDVPVLSKVDVGNPNETVKLLETILANPNEVYTAQQNYRDKILKEKELFFQQAKDIFG